MFSRIVVDLEKRHSLRYYVGSVEGLALDGVLDVAEADRHVYDFVIMVESFGAEEVVYGFSLVYN